MAKYRQVHVEFWQDGFVLDLTPEEKYFYIYLMTNSKTSQCGIYELPKRIIETETGYNRETVEKLLNRFIEYGKIRYSERTKEIFMTNWAKYNWINSTKVIRCIEKELENIKHQEFVKDYVYLLKELGYRIDTLSIQYEDGMSEKNDKPSNTNGSIRYRYPIDTVPIDSGEEEEQEEEKEQEREEEKEQEHKENNAADDAVKFYQQNFGFTNEYMIDEIVHWCNDLNDEIVIESMKRALINQKPFSYAVGIMKNWVKRNVKTIHDVHVIDKEFESKGGNQKRFGKAIRVEQQPSWLGKEEENISKPDATPEEIAAFEREKAKLFGRIKNYKDQKSG